LFFPEPLKVNDDLIERTLDQVTYDFEEKTGCQFHGEKGDHVKGCSLGYCRQRAYLIMDNLCPELGIPMESKKHKI
jgi:hypothetical protein